MHTYRGGRGREGKGGRRERDGWTDGGGRERQRRREREDKRRERESVHCCTWKVNTDTWRKHLSQGARLSLFAGNTVTKGASRKRAQTHWYKLLVQLLFLKMTDSCSLSAVCWERVSRRSKWLNSSCSRGWPWTSDPPRVLGDWTSATSSGFMWCRGSDPDLPEC